MKKLLFLISFCAAPLFAGVLSNEMGQGYPYGWLGNQSSISTTNTDINGSYTANNSTGVALGVRFISPVTQVSGNLTVYLYMPARTGSPTSVQMQVLGGPNAAEDPQRPSTATVLGTSANVDLSGGTPPFWSTFTITGVSLTAGQTYWVNVINNTDTQASNFPSFRNRALNGFLGGRINGWLTITGYTTDPTNQGSTSTEFPAVFKFDDGTLMGQPYVVTTAHANNTNDRGVRYRFSKPMNFSGLQAQVTSTTQGHVKVYQGATLFRDITLDVSEKNNPTICVLLFSSATTTFAANTDYDIMETNFTSSSATFPLINAGTGAPPDVVACTYQNQSYVDGTVPGSYTVTPNATGSFILIPDSFGATTGSAGTSVYISGN